MLWRVVRTATRAALERSGAPARPISTALASPSIYEIAISPAFLRRGGVFPGFFKPVGQFRDFHAWRRASPLEGETGRCISSLRKFRKLRRRRILRKRVENDKRGVKLFVEVCVDPGLTPNLEILNIAEMLRLNVAMAMKIAFEGLQVSGYNLLETSSSDFGVYQRVELSLLLCNDEFIRKFDKETREQDQFKGFLSLPRSTPTLNLPILILGDLVISVETAARKAEEKGYRLLDEIRILMVQGLLNLLGLNSGTSEEAGMEFEKEVELILGRLGWKRNITRHKLYECTN